MIHSSLEISIFDIAIIAKSLLSFNMSCLIILCHCLSAFTISTTVYAIVPALTPYNYFKFLCIGIPKHLDDSDRTFLDHMHP